MRKIFLLIFVFLFSLPIAVANSEDIVITEIFYDAEGSDDKKEWVEIYNSGKETIDLTGWKLNDGSNHGLNVPPKNGGQGSLVLDAGEYIVLAADAETFLLDYPSYSGTVIDTVMSLKNSSGEVKLIDPEGLEIGLTAYESSWGAAGNGFSLEKKDTSAGSEAENWAEAKVLGGTPGAENSIANNSEEPPQEDNTSPTTIADPSGGVYGKAQTVTLLANEEANIYFTVDSVDPTLESSTYELPIEVTEATTLKFFSVDLAGNVEVVQTETYVIDNVSPEFPENSELIAMAGDSKVLLSWPGTVEENLDAYFLSIDNNEFQKLELEDSFSFTVEGLENGQEYNFALKALDLAGNESGLLTTAATPIENTPPQLKINEFVSKPLADEKEWIEIFNLEEKEVSLEGFTLEDNTGVIKAFELEDSIAAGAYLVYELPAAKLNNSGDIIRLRIEEKTVDQVVYGSYDDGDASDNYSAPGEGECLTRRPDGTGSFFLMAEPSKGFANPVPPTSANDVVIKITEVDFKNSEADSVELFVADDGNAGEGVDLGGFAFADDGIFKTIAEGTTVRTGDYILFTFNSSELDDSEALNGLLKIFTADSGLVGTSEQIILQDGFGNIEDMVAWATGEPTESEVEDLEELASRGAWSGEAFDSDQVSGERTLNRIFTEEGYAETDTAEDWLARSPSLGLENPQNQAPTAVITIQQEGKCSAYVNVDGSASSDPDGDALTFDWSFGDGLLDTENDSKENPSKHDYAESGTYTIRLTVTDGLGLSAVTEQNVSVGVGNCGGSRKITKEEQVKEIIQSVSADAVIFKINEVSFNSASDWVELKILDDGNNGSGVDLGGFYFEDDKKIFTIPKDTVLQTGDFLLLFWKGNKGTKADNVDKVEGEEPYTPHILYVPSKGLTKTDEQIILKSSDGTVEDAVIWENRDGKWSRGEDQDVEELVSMDGWNSSKLEDSLDSSVIGREVVISRYPDSRDTDSAADWFATPLASPGAENNDPLLSVKDVSLLITKVDFKNPEGDRVKLICTDCAEEGTDLSGFFLKLGNSKIWEFPLGMRLKKGEIIELNVYKEDNADNADNVNKGNNVDNLNKGNEVEAEPYEPYTPYTLYKPLVGTDGLLSVRDFANQTEDFVCWTNREGTASREGDLSEKDKRQLEIQAKENHWSSAEAESCLDSREVEIGGIIVRQNQADTNSAEDWKIQNSEEKGEEEVALMSVEITPRVVTLQEARAIRISELLPNPEGPDKEGEFIELKNYRNYRINLSGWQIQSGKKIFEIPDGTFISGNGFIAFNYLETKLTLKNRNGNLKLFTPSGDLVSSMSYEKTKEGIALAWSGLNFAETSRLTPGAKNKIVTPVKKTNRKKKKSGKVSYRNGDLSDTIVISEILANPEGKDDGEWIEIMNIGSQTVNLGNWQLDDSEGGSKPFIISDTINLQPKEFIVFPRSLTKLALNNSGLEQVKILSWKGDVIDQVEFSDPEEGACLSRDQSGEIRKTEIATPGGENQFDTIKLVGKIKSSFSDSFILETDKGEYSVFFSANEISLLAKALFIVDREIKIFVKETQNRLILNNFVFAEDLLQVYKVSVLDSRMDLSVWLMAGFIFGGMFILVWKFQILEKCGVN